MTATTSAPRAPWAEPTAEMLAPAATPAPTPNAASAAARAQAQRPEAPLAGSIEDLGRQLLEQTNAVRCVAYRRSRSGQLIWQREVAATDDGARNAGGATLADEVEACRRAPVQITEPVRDAFGQIIGVIQTREASDPTF